MQDIDRNTELDVSENVRGSAPISSRPLAIDLFAGVGGMSLGFEQAGFDVVAAVEVDPVHCAVHKYNFPQSTVIPLSVVGLSADAIRQAAGIENRSVACVFGGAPCQGFSQIGKRSLHDPRNALVRDFVRLVAELDADTFVFENVKGITLGQHRGFLDELVAAFGDVGYDCVHPWRVLNAGHFGVPQSRERLILMGAKQGRALPTYPRASTNLAGKRATYRDLPFGPTCVDALGDLPDAEEFVELRENDAVAANLGTPSAYAASLRCASREDWHFGYQRIWQADLLTSSARTEHSAISRRRFAETAPGSVEPVSRFFKLAAGGVSNTLRAGTDAARGAFTSPRPIHYAYDRCITVREMARLHGFPDWFRFNVTKAHGARQIGNAVPPPLARAVASQILVALGLETTRPEEVLELGDPDLLSINQTQAAAHFAVARPPARRDRHSGARKRSQADVERDRLRRRGGR